MAICGSVSAWIKKNILGIGNATVESAAPYRNVRRGRDWKGDGCQIDLLIQTPRTAYVVEVKRMNRIGPEIEKKLERKMKRLPIRKGMSKRPVLVYDGNLEPSVEACGYFAAVIPFEKLLW